ncbi:23S rRNA m(5)U-1939 methyltransferase [Ilumatobacter fluminis]|uniref:23S rRNA m(5)U-1939 methyltransferase n=1 Tax=Ilumatobacter fluminis TaxID=467091 RepID=A0A4R7I3C3_9ACTN|nr:class I SAM-dependent RNA methyltransferase [Ilumatobacter fluminis]TDT17429.1 23S rRNA m(5)U-1939 methyltransferase [Ilumatobacter fluminis]
MTTPDDRTTLRAERYIAGGEAMAHEPDGKVVFVRGAVPGDEVLATTTERKDGWSRAVVGEVVVASSERVESPCPQRRLGCGGCDWQELAVVSQLPHKVEIVHDAFRRTAKLPDAIITRGAAVDPDGYRTTIRVVGDHDGRPSYRADRSHDLVPATGCLVAHPALRSLLDSIVIDAGLEVTLRVSAATGERTARWDRRRGDVQSLPADVGVGAKAQLTERVAGHDFRVSAGSFFQSGPAAAELLVDAVKRAAPELAGAGAVLDAYAGVGLFALAATDPASYLMTVESSRTAVADAMHNLADRRAAVEFDQVGRWRRPDGLDIDVVIADPARSGLGRPGTAAIVSAGAPVVVLISCDPVAAARDTALLHQHGYRHDGTEVLDLFPHTHHVECVTRFVAV